MIFAAVVVAAVALVALGMMFAPAVRDTDRLMDRLERFRVVVTLADGSAFEGILYDADPKTFELRDCSALDAKGEPTPADGSVFIDRDRVAYLQRP